MFAGLYPYEIVLMVMGIVLFAVLTGTLVLFVVRKRQFGKLFNFFLLPIAMIGFPGIQKIQFEKDKVSIEKYAKEGKAISAGADATALESAVERVQGRVGRQPADAETLTTLAQGNLALGHTDLALAQARRAAGINPASVKAGRLLTMSRAALALGEPDNVKSNVLEATRTNPRLTVDPNLRRTVRPIDR